MLGIGVTLDVVVYHRLLPYQPGWVAVLLGALELGIVMAVVRALELEAPLAAALGFFAAAWLLAQVLGHAGFPLLQLSYGEDGGELGRRGATLAAAALVVLAGAAGVAWATHPPTVTLAAGVHAGPLVLDRSQILAGEPGAVVQGGIVVTADDVTIRDLTVIGGDHGIEVDGAEDVTLERVLVTGSRLDGINVRRGSVEIRDCEVSGLASPYAQGIDISFGFDLDPSVVDGCRVRGGLEGIVTHFALVHLVDNAVSGAALRGITLTEMSMGMVEDNTVSGTLGVGIFCGDYSECEIEGNRVFDTRADHASGDRTRMGFAILAHYHAIAEVEDNEIHRSPGGIRGMLDGRIRRE
jgi:parallel beta-helix repeat protein